MAESTGGLGLVALRSGDLTSAEPFFQGSLLVRRELDDRPGIAFSLTNLSLLRVYEGYSSDSRGYGEEALDVRRQLGDRRGCGDTLWALGLGALQAADLDAARSRFEESLSIREEIGDRRGVCESWEGAAALRHRSGDDDEARDLLARAAGQRRDRGARPAGRRGLAGGGVRKAGWRSRLRPGQSPHRGDDPPSSRANLAAFLPSEATVMTSASAAFFEDLAKTGHVQLMQRVKGTCGSTWTMTVGSSTGTSRSTRVMSRCRERRRRPTRW